MPVNYHSTPLPATLDTSYLFSSFICVKTACTANLTLNKGLGEKRLIWAVNQIQRWPSMEGGRDRRKEGGWSPPEINFDTLILLDY